MDLKQELEKRADVFNRELEKYLKNKNVSEQDVRIVLNLFRETKSIEYAKNTALKYNARAKKALDILDDSDAKQFLIELTDYSIKREK